MRNLVVLTGTVIAIGAVAAFATNGGSGTIKACVSEKGSTRILSEGQACRSSERTVTWNQRGPQGATGATGAVGPQGPEGEKGAKGATGPAGPAGAKGATGAAGPAGSIGPAGPAGASGVAGPAGPAGPAGISTATITDGFTSTDGLVVQKAVTEGSWVVVATAHANFGARFGGSPQLETVSCVLKSDSDVIGGGSATPVTIDAPGAASVELPITGGAFIASGVKTISMSCTGAVGGYTGRLLIMKIGGFS
jgi:Collagen triple helix repeat (20 copies)